ncbi:MAG: DNA translocase FtsK, partial [Prevotellaceae bacterium]|nr:DNA translocase FtsK [Prevotellaceae bacterium]
MASKKEQLEKKQKQQKNIRITLGVILMVLAVYTLLSIISFFIYWDVDQSFIGIPLSEIEFKASNWGGRLGYLMASTFVRRWFGIAALCIPVIIAILSLKVFKVKAINSVKSVLSLSLIMLIIPLVFGVLANNHSIFGVGLGGGYGYFIGHNMLVSVFGKAGSIIILAVISVALIAYIFPPLPVQIKNIAISIFKKSDEESEEGEENTQGEIGEDDIIFEQHEGLTLTVNEEESVEEDEENEEEEMDDDEKEDVEFSVNENEDEEQVELSHSQLPYDPKLELPHYQHPSPDLLDDYHKSTQSVSADELEMNKNKIVRTLGHYNISISEIKATIGPTVTLYEIIPAPGVRISKIKGLENDIALSLSALGIRIIAPIPGKGTIGIEVPNQNPEVVPMQTIIKSPEFQDSKYELPLALGKTITNKSFVIDLAKMPHLLIAGATGQGKSVGLNAVLTSLLYKMHPSQLKLVLVDPKKVELPLYAKIEKHFLAKLPDAEDAIITDNQKVIYTINSLCMEMDARYELLKDAAVRNIREYNQKIIERRLNPEKGHRYLPYIVLVIDEFADLIMTAGREVETPIARLAQLARAIGIHLIIATQRPTTNIITGLIKANFPARIAFRVTSMIDSRTILDQSGAQQLIGKGDMLVSTGSDLTRVQCAFVDLHEVERITKFIGNQQGYPTAHILPEYAPENVEGSGNSVDLTQRDSMFETVARFIVDSQQGSTSM